MSNLYSRQDGPGTFSPDKRRVSTQDINNMRKFINESVDERLHEIIGQKHAVVRGGTVTINGGDDTKFDVEETFAVIHGQRIKVPAQAAITPGGVAATRFVILKYNLNESRQVTISATPHDLDKEDGFSLVGRDADAGVGEIRLATLNMTGATIDSVILNLDNLRVDIPAKSRILTVNPADVKSVLNVESADSRYEPIITVIPTPDPGLMNGNMQHWQANTSVASAPVGTYVADVFQYIASGPQVHDLSQQPDAPLVSDGARAGAKFSILLDVTTINATPAAGDFTLLSAKMEGLDFAAYFGKTFTVKFFVKSPLIGTYAVAFRNVNATRSFVAEYTINVANAWEEKIIPITHNTTGLWNLDETKGLDIAWALSGGTSLQTAPGSWVNGNFITTAGAVNLDASTSNTFKLAQVSLNAGLTATNNLKPDTDELHRIERYFKKWNDIHIAFHKDGVTQILVVPIPFSRIMRAIPSITFENIVVTAGASLTGVVTVTKEQTSVQVTSGSAPSANNSARFNMIADSRL